jgi:hypothetical protein
VASNANFTLLASDKNQEKVYQVKMPLPSTSGTGKTRLSIKLTFENQDGLRKALTLSQLILLKSLPLHLFTPNRHYSRPEKRVRFIGKTAPFAYLKVGESQFTSNEKGIFDIPYLLPKMSENKVDFEISALGYESRTLSVTVNRAPFKKWRSRRAKLKSRGLKTRKAYPRLQYTRLVNQSILSRETRTSYRSSGLVKPESRSRFPNRTSFLMPTCFMSYLDHF